MEICKRCRHEVPQLHADSQMCDRCHLLVERDPSAAPKAERNDEPAGKVEAPAGAAVDNDGQPPPATGGNPTFGPLPGGASVSGSSGPAAGG